MLLQHLGQYPNDLTWGKNLGNMVSCSMLVWCSKQRFPSSLLLPCICLYLMLSSPSSCLYTTLPNYPFIALNKNKKREAFFFPLIFMVPLLLFLLWIQRPVKIFKCRFGDFATDPEESDSQELVQKPCLAQEEKFSPLHLRLFKETTYFVSEVCSWPFSYP